MVHVAAGCTAGIAEHCAMYPVDLIKVNNPILTKYRKHDNLAVRPVLDRF